MPRRWRLALVVFLLFLAVWGFFSIQLQGIPHQLLLIEGEEYTLDGFFPLAMEIRRAGPEEILINGEPVTTDFAYFSPRQALTILSPAAGRTVLELRIFGFLSLKEMVVNVVPPIEVYPGGEAIGVMLYSRGVMVVEVSHVVDEEGTLHFPARDAGIAQGDLLVAIDGEEVRSKLEAAQLIHASEGSSLLFTLERSGGRGEKYSTVITPIKSGAGVFMVGIYINDGVAGVGTLSFYDPDTLRFGALGHIITDNYTRQPVEVGSGSIVQARIAGINMGKRGAPGEKYGTFFHDDHIVGEIVANTPYGIFGKLYTPLEKKDYTEPIPVASALQVKPGPAFLYTVVQGKEVEKFKVEIERVARQFQPGDKGLVIRVVDPGLLAKTGGIIQGMSGSPIIQNERLVGAVTHVFINDPTRGYGILAEWMVRESIKMVQEEKKVS